MWRNVSWNSTDSSLPEGMHRHEPGAYFKTASQQPSGEPAIKSIDELPVQAELREEEEEEEEPANCRGSRRGEQQEQEQDGGEQDEEEGAEGKNWRGASTKPSRATPQTAAAQQQQHQTTPTATTAGKQPREAHTRFKARQLSSACSAAGAASKGSRLAARSGAPPTQAQHQHQHQPTQPQPSHGQPQGFRSRLSSISGALQHPRLARRLFSGAAHGDHQSAADHHGPPSAQGPIRITTTSIDSPQHTPTAAAGHDELGHLILHGGGGGSGGTGGLELSRPTTSSSTGRRLSQLFLPQLANLPQDPYGQTSELVPPHLLGIYGQPPLVGAFGGAHRASWADISLLGRLTSMRPSLDSAFHGGQMRHSFDARSDQCNEQEFGLAGERPSCVKMMKKLAVSLLLGLLIAVSWMLVIHTLKWVALQGDPAEPLPGLVPVSLGQPAPLASRLLLADPLPSRSLLHPAALGRRHSEEEPPAEEATPAAGASATTEPLATLGAGTGTGTGTGDDEPEWLTGEPPPQLGVGRVGSSQPPPSIAAAAAAAQPRPPGLLYRAPFFTSWFLSTWNILFMPVFALVSSCCFRNEDSTTKKLLVESISHFMDNGLTTLQFLGRCAFFSLLWIATLFGIVYSLATIDATLVMALFACSAALVYLLSWVLLHQQFVGVRIVAVIICTTGIALLAYMDNSHTLGSVLIVTGSALSSAIYKVIYQRMFGFWSIAQMSLFFTLIGLFNAFLMWPVALLLYFLGAELIVWNHIPWMHLSASGALHLTANLLAYYGPICTYDIFLTLGLLMAVILCAVIDITFYKITFSGMKLAGVLLLMVGFLVCLLPENWNEFLYELVNERLARWKKQRSLKRSRNKVQDLSTGQVSRLRTPSGRVK